MLTLPWDNLTAPGAMIEITDACNITCACCYKQLGGGYKSVEAIDRDIADACRLRRVHTMAISGGEPTLHPGLDEVIRRIKRRGLFAFLLTNGVLLDGARLRTLRAAGLDGVLFHVDAGQRRPDLGAGATPQERLEELIAQAAAAGLDVSASITLGDETPAELSAIVARFLDHPELNFLFLARGIDPQAFMAGPGAARDGWLTPEAVVELLRERHGIEPFGCVPSRSGEGTHWINFFIPQVRRGPSVRGFPIRATRLDVALMRLHARLAGRSMLKTTQKPMLTLLRTLVNGLASGRPVSTLRFLLGAARPGATLCHKNLVYDHGPTWTAEGQISTCAYCVTAIVRDGALRCCCMADYAPEEQAACC